MSHSRHGGLLFIIRERINAQLIHAETGENIFCLMSSSDFISTVSVLIKIKCDYIVCKEELSKDILV